MNLRRWAAWAGAALLSAGAVALGGAPAHAAVPDRAGFALFAGGVVSHAMPVGTTVTPIAVGRWQVRFPGQAAPGGVVHVTAVHDALADPPGRWCQVDAWGPVGADELVRVSCYAPGGVLDSRPGFSVMFTRSSGPLVGGGRYGYIDSSAAGVILSQYNSAGAANSVIHAGTGFYTVSFPGMGTPGPQDGGLQVTAVNPATGARCKVGGWGSGPNGPFARIVCHNGAGALFDTRFTVSFQYRQSLYGPAFPPGRFGYLWNAPPLGPASTNFNSTGVPNMLVGAGPWTARFPNLATNLANTQVTAFSVSSNFCNLHGPWVVGGVDMFFRINCFTNAGVMVPSGFFASHSSRF
jgi:hypothetical protein